ncbi:MAG: arginine--tRNA ligase [Verrucomicrobia bacterium]|nr:MAG: arginine--tRNA ligase [Verrucomicrobiota bacterium]TAE86168.1 MAG: arginine--tRNA ligase [Verrucomicrobiota bacterium]TAF23515.1 MAG: arginine--tRNA ligase [Verrucomicrobiota bacterium]TAF40143.1 MAG: arginine--tRNA ligase [Verrucomicrobiota bacterium]
MTLIQELESRLAAAFHVVLGEPVVAPVVAAADLRFGDYQSNAAMALAKQRKTNPRALAEQVIAALDLGDLGVADIAGPGFINFKIAAGTWAVRARTQFADPRLGVPVIGMGRTVVLDFSAPNVAKPMHVGHIRSTILGDSLARIARCLGFTVITDNHIGDWGTQFGMITWAWKSSLDEQALLENPLQELLRLYRHASDSAKSDEAIREACRMELVKLQQGDAENTAIWKRCIELSRVGLDKIYDRLDVSFDHWLGESAYNEELAPLVDRLVADGLARESEGAICVFSDGSIPDPAKDPFLIRKDGEWTDFPMMVRKSDGAFNYATTDIATLEFRRREWKADAAWYVVDHRQSLHFQQLFAVAGRIGLGDMDLRHIAFGTILGTDGKPLKTRSGDLPQLADVLDDAVAAAATAVAERSRVDSEEERVALAELIGISAVKFTELAHHRLSDYVFDLDKMLALQGDTAPYLQYSVVRSRSIFRKLEEAVDLSAVVPVFTEDAELHLARFLARYGEVVPMILEDHRPNLLANYLLELARAYHSFNEACPVLKAEPAVRDSRLLLCELTSRVLVHGLGLLGIRCPDKM